MSSPKRGYSKTGQKILVPTGMDPEEYYDFLERKKGQEKEIIHEKEIVFLKKEEEDQELIYNPISQKMIPLNGNVHKTLQKKGILNSKGEVIITQKDLNEQLSIFAMKKYIRENRIYDAVTERLPYMRIVELYRLMKLCEEEIKKPERVNEFTKVMETHQKEGKEIEDIKKIRGLQ